MTVWLLIRLLTTGSTEMTEYYSEVACRTEMQRILALPLDRVAGVSCVATTITLHQ